MQMHEWAGFCCLEAIYPSRTYWPVARVVVEDALDVLLVSFVTLVLSPSVSLLPNSYHSAQLSICTLHGVAEQERDQHVLHAM